MLSTQDYGTIPKNVLELSVHNFRRELRQLRRAVRYNELAEVADEVSARTETGPLWRLGVAAGQAVRRCGVGGVARFAPFGGSEKRKLPGLF